MVKDRECSFCNDSIPPGRGKMHVKNSGRVYYFCSSKCEKNMVNLKRKSKDTEWAAGD
ncbi:50S ribosomal protein L24e [Methanonatronarchaeum sp. AMET6-2]|uniref:50S ribosomal protein L24e n=1 Tax=Methanonatronarchaeum sp. AMET6-2 TaxID=2933293 RepID=UPI001224E9A6|nr:50S ribosomal protein L24e [Methanonatronarchaeum sp. AMET6-2]RZN61896.1 MAG: 50S ribosomal protein L24e [Methanonatronarchaeia archaeon]UOY10627.1 50S ribosomal protein L24e [Methanonatronarchaeum sp. AMET6-2]